MLNVPVRLSPSGPVIANANGGEFAPGEGTIIRMAEGNDVTASGVIAITGALLAIGTPVSLENPDANRQYSLFGGYNFNETSAIASSIKVELQVAFDDPATVWQTVTVPVSGAGAEAGLTQCAANGEVFAWNCFPIGTLAPAIPANTPLLSFRIRTQLRAGTGGELGPSGQVYLRLAEHL